jgi:hypothetical protein
VTAVRTTTSSERAGGPRAGLPNIHLNGPPRGSNPSAWHGLAVRRPDAVGTSAGRARPSSIGLEQETLMSKTRLARDSRSEADFKKTFGRAVQRAIAEAVLGQAGDGRSDVQALWVARARTPSAPARLAQSQPGGVEAREQARRMYEHCLDTYRNAVRPQDSALGVDDVGAAVAFFVVCNLNALTGADPEKDTVLALERQMTGVLRSRTGWDGASIAVRQLLFEQMAILGVLVAGLATRARTESAAATANVQRAARGYLQDFLGIEPDLLAFGPNGLVLRAPVDGAVLSA